MNSPNVYTIILMVVAVACGAFIATAFFDFSTTPVMIAEYPDPVKIVMGLGGLTICSISARKGDK